MCESRCFEVEVCRAINLNRLHYSLRLDRVGEITLVMGRVVKLLNLNGGWLPGA